MPDPTDRQAEPVALARRLGLFDATMIVMGGIIGAGIFINPYVVARQVHTPALILTPWIVGGVIALAGAFVYGDLADRKPDVGGQYAYIRDAFHPVAAFLYGWTLLLVTQTGGMAAVAMTFAAYFRELTGLAIGTSVLAVATLLVLTAINCLGVRAGSNVQSALMLLKIVAVVGLVVIGSGATGARPQPASSSGSSSVPVVPLAAAMVPVLFAYGGWQTSTFVSGEMKAPRRDLPRALLIGVLGVVVLYVAVNVACLHVLGPAGLAATTTPASEVMRQVLGAPGARLIAAGIAVSTVGFLSQGMLTAPRVYFAMAQDGLFFRSVAYVDARTRAPVVAIAVQGVWASVIALSGQYEQILNYVVALDAVFFGLAGAALLVFRHRDLRPAGAFRMPGHPWTTILFVAAFWALALNTIARNPRSAGIGVLILLAGVPAYFFWTRRRPA